MACGVTSWIHSEMDVATNRPWPTTLENLRTREEELEKSRKKGESAGETVSLLQDLVRTMSEQIVSTSEEGSQSLHSIMDVSSATLFFHSSFSWRLICRGGMQLVVGDRKIMFSSIDHQKKEVEQLESDIELGEADAAAYVTKSHELYDYLSTFRTLSEAAPAKPSAEVGSLRAMMLLRTLRTNCSSSEQMYQKMVSAQKKHSSKSLLLSEIVAVNDRLQLLGKTVQPDGPLNLVVSSIGLLDLSSSCTKMTLLTECSLVSRTSLGDGRA